MKKMQSICSDDGCLGSGGRVVVLQVEAGPGLGELEVVLRLLPLGVALPPELGQLALQRHLLVVPGHWQFIDMQGRESMHVELYA